GRRSAEDATPGTSERQGQARARESLEALIDALHERGWVLGAPLGEGAGIRTDGSVTVLDLSGLRPQEATGARLEDRRWVDSVLRDEGRTLRRRIDARGTPRPSGPSSPALPTTVDEPSPHAGGPVGGGMPGQPGGTVPSGDPAPLDAAGPEPDVPFAEPFDGCEQEAPSLRPLPAPMTPHRATPSQGLRAGRVRSRLRGAGLGRRVQEVLRAPRPRRIALLSAAAVLIAGGALGSGAWWLVPESSAPAPPAGAAPSASSPADGSTGAPEGTEHPRIIDPLSLATDLAHTRYEYVTGHGTDAVAAPGSPAEEADEQVRRAYQGTVVEGGQPEVLAAHVVAGPTPQGTARLEAENVTPAHTVTESDCSNAAVAATAAATVQLELSWRDGHWRVSEFHPGGTAGGTGPPGPARFRPRPDGPGAAPPPGGPGRSAAPSPTASPAGSRPARGARHRMVPGPSFVSISGYRRPGGSQAEIGLEVPGLQALLHVAEEAGGVGTVDQTVVVGQEDVHHRPDGDRIVALRVLHHRRSLGDGAGAEDGHVRVRHDRGVEQRTARPGVGDRERRPGQIIRSQVVALGAGTEVPDLSGQTGQVQVTGVLDDRDHQPALGVRRHADVLDRRVLDHLPIDLGVDLRVHLQSLDRGLDQERQEGELGPL